jgi:hypothetical protein
VVIVDFPAFHGHFENVGGHRFPSFEVALSGDLYRCVFLREAH